MNKNRRVCVLLEAMGVEPNSRAVGVDKKWVKDICIKKCPLEDYCVFDVRGHISKNDIELLRNKAKELKGETSSD